MGADFSRTSRANCRGRRIKRSPIAGVDEKSTTTNNDQLKQDALAFETKLAALKEELRAELRDEMQRKFDMKAEAEARIEKACVQYKAGKYEMALEECSRSIAMAPFAIAYYIRGAINHKMSQDEQAMNDLKESAKLGYHKAQDLLASKNISY